MNKRCAKEFETRTFTMKKQLYIGVCTLSYVQLFMTPWTVAFQAPLSMEFSRQEEWNGLPFPTPGNLPNPGIELASLVSPVLASRFFTTATPGNLN